MRFIPDPTGAMGPGGMVKTIAVPSAPKAPTPAGVSYAGGRGADPAAMSALQRAMAYYAPGGGYGKGVEAGLERGRVKAVATGAQSLVSAGLAGTTTIAGLGKRYEEEVAMPARARVEETRAGAISGLEAMKAQIKSITNISCSITSKYINATWYYAATISCASRYTCTNT